MTDVNLSEPAPGESFQLGDWTIRTDINAALRGEEMRRLESRTVAVLSYLHANQGRVVSKTELLDAVWKKPAISDHAVTVAISSLRRMLGDDSRIPRYIQTIPGKGYRLIAHGCGDGADGLEAGAMTLPANGAGAAAGIGMNGASGHGGHGGGAAFAPPRPKRWWPVALPATALVALVIAGVAFNRGAGPEPDDPAALADGDSVARVRPFTTLEGRVFGPSFSPDDSKVAFAWNRGNHYEFDLYVKSVGTEDLRRLTDVPGYDSNPAWSPDGGRIAFIRRSWDDKQGDCGVYVVPAEGGVERRVATCAMSMMLNVSWSTDGRALFFPSWEASDRGRHIARLDLDTMRLVPLSRPPERYTGDDMTAISPDGTILAYRRVCRDFSTDIYLQRLTADGTPDGEAIRLTRDRELVTDLDWSPDGRFLYFNSNRDGIFSLWRIPSDGGVPERAVQTSTYVHGAAIARDGQTFILDQRDEAVNLAVQTVGTEGGAPVFVTNSKRFEWAGEISPDGERILFLSDQSGMTGLWTARNDGSDAHLLHTKDPGTSYEDPTWSPLGDRIALTVSASENLDIHVINADGGPLRRLTFDPAEDVNPTWSSDGATLYFTSNRTGSYQIWALTLADGSLTQVTTEGGYRVQEAEDPRFLLVSSPGKKSGIWQVHKSGEVPRRLVVPDAVIGASPWQRRGAQLYFLEFAGEEEARIMRYALDGPDDRETEPFLFLDRPPSDGDFSISPDGSRVLFGLLSRYDGQLFQLTLSPSEA